MTQYPGYPPQAGVPAFPQQPAQPQYQQPSAPAPQYQQPAAPFSLSDVPATANRGGNYLPKGEWDYAANIENVKIFQGNTGLSFIVEFTIAESNNPDVPQGARHSWVKKIDPASDPFKYGRIDVKAWLCEVIRHKFPDSDPAGQWDDRFIPWAAADGDANNPQPARGMQMHIHTWEKVKGRTDEEKRRGETITICDWRAMKEDEVLGVAPPMAPPQMPPVAPMAPPQMPPMPTAPQQSYQAPAAPQVTGGPPPGWPAGQPWPPGGPPPQPAPIDDIPF